MSWNLRGIAVREVPDDDIVLREGIAGGLGLKGHCAAPRVELACNGLETRRRKGVNRDLSEELAGGRRGSDGNGEESLGVPEVNL